MTIDRQKRIGDRPDMIIVPKIILALLLIVSTMCLALVFINMVSSTSNQNSLIESSAGAMIAMPPGLESQAVTYVGRASMTRTGESRSADWLFLPTNPTIYVSDNGVSVPNDWKPSTNGTLFVKMPDGIYRPVYVKSYDWNSSSRTNRTGHAEHEIQLE